MLRRWRMQVQSLVEPGRRQHRRSGLRGCAVLLSLVVLAPMDVAGQDAAAPGAWHVSPMIGVALDPDADGGAMLSGAVGYGLTELLTVEGEVSHVFDWARDDPDVDSGLTTAAVSLLRRFGSGPLRPYVSAGLGAGWYSLAVQVPPADVDATAFAFSIGAGATWLVNSRVGVRGDFRYINYTHGESSDPANLLIVDDVPTTWRFAGGLLVRVGG